MRDFKELFGELVKAGVHFGHQKSRWCPKMEPYIWGYKNKVHLINVYQTASQLEKAEKFLESISADGGTILFVGTKKAASEAIVNAAKKVGMPYVNHRWLGGTLLNFTQVKKSLTRLLHYEDILAKAEENPFYTKKELNIFKKSVEKLEKTVGGIRKLALPIAAVVVVDVNKERSAVKEASSMGVPVIGFVDTNSDPSDVDFVIPANDDSPQAINLLLNYLTAAIEKGRSVASKTEKLVAAAKVEEVMPEEPAIVELDVDSDLL